MKRGHEPMGLGASRYCLCIPVYKTETRTRDDGLDVMVMGEVTDWMNFGHCPLHTDSPAHELPAGIP